MKRCSPSPEWYSGPAESGKILRVGTPWDGDEYQRRFDALATAGKDVHGEAAFVMAMEPGSVLDAGCGTGRVAIELPEGR